MFKKKAIPVESQASKHYKAGFKEIADKINYSAKTDVGIQKLLKRIGKIMREQEPTFLCRLFCSGPRRRQKTLDTGKESIQVFKKKITPTESEALLSLGLGSKRLLINQL